MLFCLREVPVGIALLLDDTDQRLPRSEDVGLEERCRLALVSLLADRHQGAVFLLGALFPTLVGYISQQLTLSSAIAIFAIFAYGLFFVCAYALPETRGKVLRADG